MNQKKLSIDMVLITDFVGKTKSYNLRSTDAEGISENSAHIIYETLCSICRSVIWLEGYNEFAKNPIQFKDHVIFPMYYGKAQRSSKAIIPAICEANNLSYIGADSYTHMLCNDKHTAKKFASEFGIKSSKGCLIYNNYQKFDNLNFPVIIKPNFGGGSNGIIKTNLCYTQHKAEKLIKKLMKYQNMPILVEEYIDGQELEIILFGNNKKIHLSEEVQIIKGNEEYFTDWIWGLEDKKIDDSLVSFKHSKILRSNDIYNCKKLFKSLNKVEYMRVDCRVKNNEAYLVELSPDCYLGIDSGFNFLFEKLGYTFNDMLKSIILNTIDPNYSLAYPAHE